MHLDIRLPIGSLFSVLGAILVVFGLVSKQGIYERSLGININLWWGLVMLAFGVAMFVMGFRGTSSVRTGIKRQKAEGRRRDSAVRNSGFRLGCQYVGAVGTDGRRSLPATWLVRFCCSWS